MVSEPTEKLTDLDKSQHALIKIVCAELFNDIDGADRGVSDRSIPPSRSDLWVSSYRDDLIAMIRARLSPSIIVLNREIIKCWLAVRKNPEQHGVQKRDTAKTRKPEQAE